MPVVTMFLYNKSAIGDITMTDNELLLAISEISDKKLDSELKLIKNDIHSIQNEICNMNFSKKISFALSEYDRIRCAQEYNRYRNYTDKIQAAFTDVELQTCS